MFVRCLRLKNFRSYENVSLELSARGNVFCGENAQGKTNLLEAVYLCSCARSHRTGKDSELIFKGASAYEVELAYTADNGAEGDIRIRYEEKDLFSPLQAESTRAGKKKSREIYHNGQPLEKVAELFGIFHAVMFAPEDLMLVKEGPAGRRRYLDMLISQLSPSYFRDLQLYQRILLQRNQLLKRFRDRSSGFAQDAVSRRIQRVELEVWNDQMAECGARIIAARKRFSDRVEEIAGRAVRMLSGEQETLQAVYRCTGGVNPEAGLSEIHAGLLNKIARAEEEDLLRGYSSQGPHRDDLELSLNTLPIRQYASQGQQRSVVLALKLAELTLIEEECKESPVLLLDDVMSELDLHRRHYLMEAISGRQVLITCTDREQARSAESDPARIYSVCCSQLTLAGDSD